MKLSDIIDLAKSGYSVADVKELLTLAEDTSPTTIEEKPIEVSDSESSVSEVINNDETDYKSLYEESQELIRKLQQTNIHTNIDTDNSLSDQDRINDFVMNFGK